MANIEQQQVAWITGASRGIGLATATELDRKNWIVVAATRRPEELELAKKRGLLSHNVHVMVCDIRSRESVEECHRRIVSQFGRVDALINNAGTGIFKPVLELSDDDLSEMITVNLYGAFRCISSVLPSMVQRGSGAILNVLSVAVKTAFAGSAGYAASKAALDAFSSSLRREVRSAGVKVIDIYPGATETAIWSEEMLAQHRHRMMHPENIAEMIGYLLSLPPHVMPEEVVLRPQLGDL